MADPLLMAMWPPKADEYGCFEFVIPNQAIYMLSHADGATVSISDETGRLVPHENVQWYLDLGQMQDGGEVVQERYVTTERLSETAAKEWALEIADENA